MDLGAITLSYCNDGGRDGDGNMNGGGSHSMDREGGDSFSLEGKQQQPSVKSRQRSYRI